MCGDWRTFQCPPADKRCWPLQLVLRDHTSRALARIFWRVLDALDYRVMQARLWLIDALYGPEPETGADRQRPNQDL